MGGKLQGLQTMDIRTGKFTKIFQKSAPFPGGAAVLNILKDRNNRVWVGTNSGLARLDETSGGYKGYLPSIVAVNILLKDSNGNLWAGTARAYINTIKKKMILNF